MTCPRCLDKRFSMLVTQTYQGGRRMIHLQCNSCTYSDYITPEKYDELRRKAEKD